MEGAAERAGLEPSSLGEPPPLPGLCAGARARLGGITVQWPAKSWSARGLRGKGRAGGVNTDENPLFFFFFAKLGKEASRALKMYVLSYYSGG